MTSKTRTRFGVALSTLAVLFLLFDAIGKVMQIQPVRDSFVELGYPLGTAFGIGVLELLCVLVYMVPATAVLGGVLLTGYLGGAIATHVRIGSPLASHTLFPVYIALFVWGGLFLRDSRTWALLVPRR